MRAASLAWCRMVISSGGEERVRSSRSFPPEQRSGGLVQGALDLLIVLLRRTQSVPRDEQRRTDDVQAVQTDGSDDERAVFAANHPVFLPSSFR